MSEIGKPLRKIRIEPERRRIEPVPRREPRRERPPVRSPQKTPAKT